MNQQQPLTTIEVQISLTYVTMAQIILLCLVIFLVYFIIKNRFA